MIAGARCAIFAALPGAAPTTASEAPGWARGGGALIAALALALGAGFPYAEATRNANERPRLLQGIALVDEGAWSIDSAAARYRLAPGPDVARDPRSGRIFPNKPPGTGVVAAAALTIARAADEAPTLRGYTWWARLLGGLVPTLALVAFLWWRFAGVIGPRALAAGLALYALGTPAAAYSHLFYGHQLAAALLTIGSVLAIDGVQGRRRGLAALGGGIAAAAVTVEYAAAFAGAPLGIWMIGRLLREGRAATGAVAAATLGALGPIAALAAYHVHAFGGALRTGYHHAADPGFAAKHAEGLLGLGAPRWAGIEAQLLGLGGGLVAWAPLVIVGAIGLARGGEAATRAHRGALLANVAIFAAMAASLSFDGGWRVGPRYMVAVMPAAALGIGWALARWGEHMAVLGAMSVIAGYSLVVNSLAANLWPHFDLSAVNQPVAEVLLPLWRAGRAPYGVLGTGARVGLALVIGLGALGLAGRPGWRALAVAALGGALGAAGGTATERATPHPRAAQNLAYIERVWEPPVGGGAAPSASVRRR